MILSPARRLHGPVPAHPLASPAVGSGATMRGLALPALLLASVLMLPLPAGAQTDMPPNSGATGTPGLPPLNPPVVDNLNPSPGDAPNPLTGELVPLPAAPPRDPAAATALPDCAPPACGTPQIME